MDMDLDLNIPENMFTSSDYPYFQAFNVDFHFEDTPSPLEDMPNEHINNDVGTPNELISWRYPHSLSQSQMALLDDEDVKENSEKNCSHQLSTNSKKIKKAKKNDSCDESNIENNSNKKQRCTWIAAEDAQLIDLVEKYGQKWTKLAKIMGQRTAKQIRDRYLHKLRPGLKAKDWSEEEDALLIFLYDKYGAKWARIVNHMPNRTENQVKYRFKSKHSQNLPNYSCPELIVQNCSYSADSPSSTSENRSNTLFTQMAEQILNQTCVESLIPDLIEEREQKVVLDSDSTDYFINSSIFQHGLSESPIESSTDFF